MVLTFTKETKVIQESKDIDELYEVIFYLHMPRLIVDGKVVRTGAKLDYDIPNVSARLRYIGVDTLDDSVLESDILVAEVVGQPVIDYFNANPGDWNVLKGIFRKIGKSTGVVPFSATTL